MTFDDSYRVGRCNSCRNRPAFAWKASTGLRIDDGMRCPRCRNLLDRTSREARYMREFTEDELVYVFESTRNNLRVRLERSTERHDEAKASGMEEFVLSMYREYVERDAKDYTRVDDGYRRWMMSATDAHDEAVQSGR